MISEKTPYIPIGANFDQISEIETVSHLRVQTIDIRLISELRQMKYDVGPDGIIIWDKDNGYNNSIKSRKILDQWINFLDITEVKLYNIVLPQSITIEDYKRIFFIEEDVVTDYNGELNFNTYDIRNKFYDKDSAPQTLYEGVFLVCY